MKKFETLDLLPLMNHKLIYERLPEGKGKDDFGLDNICILQEDFKFHSEEWVNEVKFRFETGNYDNIICEKQRLKINTAAEKLHVIGFSYWGDACEFFGLIDEDGRKESLPIGLSDWSHKAKEESFNHFLFKANNISFAKAVLSSGAMKHIIYFHHSVCVLPKNKKIREIVFPDNMFVHIFAMTLEKEDGEG